MIDEHTSVGSRHVLCVLGAGLDLDEVEAIAETEGFELDWEYSGHAPDPRMPAAFEACGAGASFTAPDWEAVRGHDTVAYLLSPPARPGVAFTVARRTLALTARLLRSGATAVKNESNGLAHGRDRWLDLAYKAYAGQEAAVPLYQACVKRPITTGALYFSCGMHLLGAPDVELDHPGAPHPEDVLDLIDGLALYLLMEQRTRELRDGETFALEDGADQWVLRHGPCERFAEDDFFHNPHGYWRLTPGRGTSA